MRKGRGRKGRGKGKKGRKGRKREDRGRERAFAHNTTQHAGTKKERERQESAEVLWVWKGNVDRANYETGQIACPPKTTKVQKERESGSNKSKQASKQKKKKKKTKTNRRRRCKEDKGGGDKKERCDKQHKQLCPRTQCVSANTDMATLKKKKRDGGGRRKKEKKQSNKTKKKTNQGTKRNKTKKQTLWNGQLPVWLFLLLLLFVCKRT